MAASRKISPPDLRARTEPEPKHHFPGSSAIYQELLESFDHAPQFSPRDLMPCQVHDSYPYPVAQVAVVHLPVSRLPLHLAVLPKPGYLLRNVMFTHEKEREDDGDGYRRSGAEA